MGECHAQDFGTADCIFGRSSGRDSRSGICPAAGRGGFGHRSVGWDDPIVLATFKAYPDGGQALSDRVRVLILQNNYLATDVARAIKTDGLLGPAQRAATEKGLAEALSRLGVTAQEEAGLSGAQWAALVNDSGDRRRRARLWTVRSQQESKSELIQSFRQGW